MTNIKENSIKFINEIVMPIVVALVAVSLNVLLTVKLDDSHIGIRVAATDFIIPVISLFFVGSIFFKKKVPTLIVPFGWKLLILMSLWMLVCLINGYLYTGVLITWALINKFFGWFILLSYFVSGVFIGTREKKLKVIFISVLLLASWLICAVEIAAHWFFSHGFFHEYGYIANHHRLQGLYQNPNAFGIFLSVLFIIHMYVIKKNLSIFYKITVTLGSVLTLLCIFYSYSRSAWVGLFLGIIVCAILDKKIIQKIVLACILTFALNFAAFSDRTENINNKMIEYYYFDVQGLVMKVQSVINKMQKQVGILVDNNANNTMEKRIDVSNNVIESKNIDEDDVKNITRSKATQLTVNRLTAVDRIKSDGLSVRIEIFKRSMSYWFKSPILGTGLGVYMWNSQKEDALPDTFTIHNSANWLLVETGIIGLMIFSIFIVMCLSSLWYESSGENEFISSHAMICIIFVIMGASIATEVIYQRYFWLLLGLFLVKTRN